MVVKCYKDDDFSNTLFFGEEIKYKQVYVEVKDNEDINKFFDTVDEKIKELTECNPNFTRVIFERNFKKVKNGHLKFVLVILSNKNTEEHYLMTNCDTWLMTDEGRTIERLA